MYNYKIIDLIGEGTYGKVFKAVHRQTNRVVAIKRFKQNESEDEHVRKTMNREIKVLNDFKNDNIVSLIEVFREKEKLHLVFEFEERTLLEELQL